MKSKPLALPQAEPREQLRRETVGAGVSITSIKCVLTQEHLDAICAKYFVPEEVHPQLPSSDATMHERPTGKIGMYTRFFDYANYRIPFSTFFVSVLTHFRIPFSQLSVFGSAKVSHFEILCRVCNIEPDVSLFRYFYTHNYKNGWFGFTKRPNVRACYSKNLDSVKNWNDHFFWVDEFVVPANARFSWFSGSNIVKDRAPAPSEYNVEHVNTLIAQASPFLRFPEEFLCWVGISRNYLLNKDTYPRFEYENGEGGFYFPHGWDLNAFIRTADPRKVRIVERPRAKNERPIITVAKHRTVTLLPTSVVRSSGELSASVERELLEMQENQLKLKVPKAQPFRRKKITMKMMTPPASPSTQKIKGRLWDYWWFRYWRAKIVTDTVTAPRFNTLVITSNYRSLRKQDKSATHHAVFGSSSSSEKTDRTLSLFTGRSGSGFDAGASHSRNESVDQTLSDLGAFSSSLKSQNQSLVDQVHELETSSADLREKLETYEGSLKQLEEFQDNLMEPLRTRLAEIDIDFTRCCMRFQESFHPHLLNVIAGRRWLLTHGCRCLTDLEAYIPSAKDDFNSAIRDLRDLNFPLLQELFRQEGCQHMGYYGSSPFGRHRG
ncbi:hypothetical protein Tco_1477147 [Tanacetum coccineum]